MFLDCIPKKQLILVIFYLFMVVFGAPTGQPGAPFIFKACILVYNNIFFIKVLKNWMCLDCIPKKQLIFVIFRYLWQFFGPLQASLGPHLYSKPVFQYTIIFSLSRFSRIGCFLTDYPKKSSFQSFFSYFWQFFGPLQASPRLPFCSKPVFQHTITFSLSKSLELDVTSLHTQKIAHFC